MLTLALLITQLFVLGILTWGICGYIRLGLQVRNMIRRFVNMELDDIIDDLLDADDTGAERRHAVAKQTERRAGLETTHCVGGEDTGTTDTKYQQHRERLAALAAGGQARQYLGKDWTVEEIDSLGEDEVGKLYARYEARLGAAMTKTLGRAALQFYTAVASMTLPIPPEKRQPLMTDLESDPFVGHALNSTACDLYHRYGKLLAPITATLTTAKHCRFGHQCPVAHIEDGEQPGQQCDDATPVGDSGVEGDSAA